MKVARGGRCDLLKGRKSSQSGSSVECHVYQSVLRGYLLKAKWFVGVFKHIFSGVSGPDVLSPSSRLLGVLPVHPASAAARHRPSAGRGGEGEGGGGRAGRSAVAAAASLASAQQLAAPADGGQGRPVRGGGRGEERQRRGVHRGQLVLPHNSRVHRCKGTRS